MYIYCWNTWETHHSDKFETQLHKMCIRGTQQSLADYFHIPGHCLFLYKYYQISTVFIYMSHPLIHLNYATF